jgi:NAD(P)-dependent dehydrogenase (short-subunit alcohol dehydrogenase family)
MNGRGPALAGRRAVVTGASRGIGRAIAMRFAEEGADVAIVARNVERLDEVAEAIRGFGRTCVVVATDVTADEAPSLIVDSAVGALGGLDILVNNAGGNSFMAPLQTMRFSGWQKTMALNLDSTVRLTQAALPALLESSHGSVVNVASVAGLNGSPLMAHYGAAKAAIISLSRSLALEVAAQGLRVNTLVPGWIDTDLTDFLRGDENVESSVLSRVPMGRWGRDEEIAEAALFLASDASSFMTGQELIIDGGLTANP